LRGIKNKELSNVFCNYAVTYTTKVLIPIKLVLKRVQEILPFTGVGLVVGTWYGKNRSGLYNQPGCIGISGTASGSICYSLGIRFV
jgi:hypothetical protein